MLRALFKGLLGSGSHSPGAPLIADADIDPKLPARLRGLISRANEEGCRGNLAKVLAELDRARQAFADSSWPPLLQALAHEREGRTADAARCEAAAIALDAATARDDSAAQHFHTRGLIHLRDGGIAPARRAFELAHRLLPDAPAPLDMLGYTGYFEGDVEAARRDYDRALAVAPPDARGLLRINRLIDTLPQMFPSGRALDKARLDYERELDELLAAPPSLPDPLAVHRTMFYLCYQGRNDRDLNAKLARLFQRSSPGLDYAAACAGTRRDPAARPCVGFVSKSLGRHSIGAWYTGLVRRVIESGRFDCVVFTYETGVDEQLREVAEAHGRHVYLDRALATAREQIMACQLDILIYTDVGTHPFLYFLSFARLAPVQALLVGHPCTSGVAAIDYFVSNVHQDRDDAQAHYSERLARLPVIPVYVEKNKPPTTQMSRTECGFGEASRIYLCPMMLQKMHPEFDWAIAEILRRDPGGEVVLFGSRERPLWDAQLERRFEAEMPDVAARIVFRPFARHEEFLNLLMHADCVLDPFHFSGGVTTYVAFSVGVPVITLPGELLRSRMTAGIYAQAEVDGCTARSREHFVELALEFANNPSLRAAKGAEITAAHPRIFETREGVDALMDWMDSVVA